MSGRRALRLSDGALSSKRYAPEVACARKVRYETWEEAEKIAALHAQRDHVLVLANKCDFCDGWHTAKPLSAMRSPCNDPIRGELMRRLRP